MTLSRRPLLAALAALPWARDAWAQAQGQPESPGPTPPQAQGGGSAELPERAIGKPDAKVTVQEWFSLTCTHCAAFQKQTFPKVKAELIDTGRVRWVWKDFPLDQLALYGAMVARALPPDRYEPFITALLTTQARWAFNRAVNPMEELMKLSLLAGMPRSTYDSVVRDEKLKNAILAEQARGEKEYGVNSTPTFIVNGKPLPGAVPYDTLLKAVETAEAAAS